MQITIDNCVEVEQIAKDLLLEDLLQNIGECYKKNNNNKLYCSCYSCIIH